MAFTKAQLEAIKNTLLASNQPILANQHREQIQSIIDEMYDSQSRANILVGVQADTIQGNSDTFLAFRNGQAFQLPLSLLNSNSLENLGDVFIADLQDGEILVYNAVADRWENKNIFLGFAISNLSDVELNALANGDILRYNSATDKWDNVSLASILAPYALLTDLDAYQLLSEKGQANGYAQLDTGAKLPISIIPDSVLGQVEYQGTWNAATNTPTLPTTPDKKGDYYVVSTAGTFVGIDFEIGDWIISNGLEWEKVNNTDAVRTVFGRLGDVVANANDYASFYVTLDTAQTITGFKTFGSTIFANDGVRLEQAGSSSRTRLINLGSTFITALGTNQFGFNSSNNIYFAGSNKFGGQLAWNNTANRTYTLQDASGTIALTSDLHAALTLGTANGLFLTGQQLSLELASTSSTGALSAANFNIFNAKVGGTGSAGQVAFWTGAGTQSGDGGFLWDNNSKLLTINKLAIASNVGGYLEFGINGYNVPFLGLNNSYIYSGQGSTTGFLAGSLNLQSRSTINRDINFITGSDSLLRWSVLGTGEFQSNGAQTIRTSSGILTLQPLGGITSGINATANINFYSASNTGVIRNTVTNGSVVIAGGNSTGDGGNIGLGGSTGANNINFRIGGVSHWSIKPDGILESVGSKTIQTSTGNLTLQGNGGNVGIGTTSPSAILHLSSDAPVLTATSTNNSSGLRINVTGTASTVHRFQYNNNTLLTIFSDGNTTIGSTAQLTGGDSLQVSGVTNSGGGFIVSPNNAFSDNIDFPIIESGARSPDTSVFGGNTYRFDQRMSGGTLGYTYNFIGRTRGAGGGEGTPINIMSFLNNGNVGIGTTSPSEKLQIAGGNVRISGGTAGSRSLTIQALTAGDTSINLIPSTGGIGKLNVNGSFPLALSTNGTERLRVTQTGNLIVALAGIPTSDPNIEGQLYRNNTGQLFISLGVV